MFYKDKSIGIVLKLERGCISVEDYDHFMNSNLTYISNEKKAVDTYYEKLKQ
ncbi:hypothetical protein FORC13_p068 (plasmid) [Bacillus cereus]|nr:hypothetical protein FORC13_p068 [Bacillus cereus]